MSFADEEMANLSPGNIVDMADKAMNKSGMASKGVEAADKNTSTQSKEDSLGTKMAAVTFMGKKNVTVSHCPKPAITDDRDVIVRMTSSGLCGTDLHLYLGCIPGIQAGRVIGHEVMGIIDSIGSQVNGLNKGDRVIVSCQIACGECYFCKQEEFSQCDRTNPSILQEHMLGQRTSGLLGFSELNGGFDGGQADFVRVPLADMNCLKVPPENELGDEKLLPLTDILCTAWYGNELGKVKSGDVVAVWGAGPVGLLAAQCAFARGAHRVIIVDEIPYRLEFAKKIIPKIETVDFSKDDSGAFAGEKQVLELCKDEPAHAPDVCIECVGMHYAHSFMHRMEMAFGMETDTPEALNAAIYTCKKGGCVVGIGAYVGMTNHFTLGTLMMKSVTLKTGQVPVQRYWKQLLEMIKKGELDPAAIFTHKMTLDEAPKAYHIFNEKLDGVIKVVLKPSRSMGK